MNFKSFLPHLIAFVVFFVATVVAFTPQFSGKRLIQGDNVAYRGVAKEFTDYKEETGDRALWTGSVFGGMPTYQINSVQDGNALRYAGEAFQAWMAHPVGYFFAGMLGFYILMVVCGVNPFLAIAGALGSMLTVNNLVLFTVGHNTKIAVVAFLPLIAAGMILAFRRKYLVGGLMFALGMGLAIGANHPQMLYYFGLTTLFYGLAQLVGAVRAGELPHFAKATGALLLGLLLGVGSGASNLLTTQDYLPSSIRGGTVLSSEAAATNQATASSDGGLGWDYAMAWSNGFADLVATYVPIAAGGGSGEEIERGTAFGRSMRQLGANLPATFAAPLYHGSLPFTEGPAYLGAVVFALFIFGLFTARLPLRVWFGGGTLLIFLVSLGSNFEGLNRLLFDSLPLLNKFRAPSSALVIAVFPMLALGIFGIHNWMKQPAEVRSRQLKFAGITSAALGLLALFVFPSMIDFAGPNDVGTLSRFLGGQTPPENVVDGLVETRRDLYSADAWRSFLFVGLTYGTLFLLLRGTLSLTLASVGLAALLVLDMSGIDGRYYSKDEFRTVRSSTGAAFAQTPADQTILADSDPHFRVLNTTAALDQDSRTSYYHKSIGGYSAVKMRRYQDVIDGYLRQRDLGVLSMLNTKYFIVQGADGQLAAQRNPNAFGNAWIVNSIQFVDGADAEFAALAEVENLKGVGIVEREFADELVGLEPTGAGTVALTDYDPMALTYTFNSPAEQLVVFSETWYGPDKGWNLYVDGEPVELIRANYLLRAARIPAGQHTLEMKFEPAAYATGYAVSLICSLLILLGLLALLTIRFLQRRRVDNTATPTAQVA